MRLRKAKLTAGFDADLVKWFRGMGHGYQARMNAVLRSFMLAVISKEILSRGDRTGRGTRSGGCRRRRRRDGAGLRDRSPMVYIRESYRRRLHMEHEAVLVGAVEAVRLPKAYRFEGEEVRIRRLGEAVLLEPVARDWTWLDAVTGPVDANFAAAAAERPAGQERPGLDVFE